MTKTHARIAVGAALLLLCGFAYASAKKKPKASPGGTITVESGEQVDGDGNTIAQLDNTDWPDLWNWALQD